MAFSRHFEHLRTDFKPALPVPEPLPDTTNKFELRRDRAQIKIPKRLSLIIAKDKKLLKPFAIYFEIKPLYYSSVIKNARHHYPDLCEYLGISINNLRQKIGDMVRLDLAWWDGRDLRLTAYHKVCKQYSLNRFYHQVNNIGNTELNLRYVALKENLDNQTYVLTKKIISNEVKQVLVEDRLHRMKSEMRERQIECTPEMVKREFSGIETLDPEKVYSGNKLKQIKRVTKLRLDVLKQQSQERTDNNLLNGIKCSKTANPTATLSCKGVATLYGCVSAAAGYYWEQILQKKQLLAIYGQVIEIQNHRNPIIWDKQVQQVNNGVFHTLTKKGKLFYFLRLANTLILTQPMQNPLFS